MRFEVQVRAGAARAGLLHTPRGVVPTPCFMPVGTQGTVRALAPDDLRRIGTPMVLANTFHLYLRPGHELIHRAGGLHAFMGWDGPILTDSGGFQVFSLAHLRRVGNDGVVFRSPFDGSEHVFTPERVAEIQQALGSDIVMPLDVCSPYPCGDDEARQALDRTIRWLERARAAHRSPAQGLFGIVQGGFDLRLRRQAALAVGAMDLDGVAIGGLSVGEPHETMYEILATVLPLLPEDRPRYLMGLGSAPALAEAVARGVDLFDCALPTRAARTGVVLTQNGRINLRNARYREDLRPLDPACACEVCRTFSRAYVRHLFKANEMLGPRLVTFHNVFFTTRWMTEMRQAIVGGTFDAWLAEVRRRYATRW
ncbi:MAG: tRNA guanosine(34) transglycosylase Tgt [Armatimonadota bacterium]|nr:tRNA guanosine(34) transglycosylase Tgt [Armatimonadota bacterium]MDR5697712.1 tRNA guanosine(34) transglycosylase Tgt [Armatimonadota bacterium]